MWHRPRVRWAVGPAGRWQAFALFLGTGVATGTGAISTAWALDATDSYPGLPASIATVPGITLSSYYLLPGVVGAVDCSDGTLTYAELGQRVWIPAVLGGVPAVVTWWVSDASLDVAMTPDLRADYQGVAVVGRW